MKQILLILSFLFYTLAAFCQDAVDLGLSVKWATCNVGASKPEEYGKYYTFDGAQELANLDWRVPTKEELQELVDKCTWQWVQQNGVSGYKVVGKNGNSIFLPAGGYSLGPEVYNRVCYGYYWSSSANGSSGAYYLYFYSGNAYMCYGSRYYGRSVRLVRGL